MSVILKEIILRMLISGVICTVALIIAGEGIYKEPVRLCCAGVVIIMLFTPYNNKIPDISSVLDYKYELEKYIKDEMQKVENAEHEQVISKLKETLDKKLNNMGISCNIEMGYKLSDNTFLIDRAEIVGNIDSTAKEYISTLLESEYGIDKNRIIFMEEGE